MKEGIEKILKKYVFGDVGVVYYDIEVYPTPENQRKFYEIEIYLSLSTSIDAAEDLMERLKTGMAMMGFTQIFVNMSYETERDKLLVKGTAYIKQTT
jgi:hypothetical protein